MKEKLLYFANDSHDPYFNQAFEEYIFNTCLEGDILLLWRNDPAVVCGNYQNIFAEVNVPEAMERKIAVVRRPSGGGTVFHDLGNLNYTLIRSCKAAEVTYEPFILPMVQALNAIGIPAEMNRTCDIAIDGLKVSGSAQKIVRDRVLHHGTLLYHCDLKALTTVANGQRACFESKGTKSVPWPVTNMAEHLTGEKMTMDEFVAKLRDALGEQYELEERSLGEEDLAKVREAAKNRYQDWEWTYGRSPAFTCRRTFSWRGEDVTVEYSAKRGVIETIRFTPEKPRWSALLEGKRLCVEELRALFANEKDDCELYRFIF